MNFTMPTPADEPASTAIRIAGELVQLALELRRAEPTETADAAMRFATYQVAREVADATNDDAILAMMDGLFVLGIERFGRAKLALMCAIAGENLATAAAAGKSVDNPQRQRRSR